MQYTVHREQGKAVIHKADCTISQRGRFQIRNGPLEPPVTTVRYRFSSGLSQPVQFTLGGDTRRQFLVEPRWRVRGATGDTRTLQVECRPPRVYAVRMVPKEGGTDGDRSEAIGNAGSRQVRASDRDRSRDRTSGSRWPTGDDRPRLRGLRTPWIPETRP